MTSSLAVLLRGEESEGRLALVELDVAPGAPGPPLHVHETWDEGFYVLAGEITFQAGERRVTARAGMFVFAPRGTPHTFANLSGHDARMLLILTPAGFERFAESGERPPPDSRAVGLPLMG
jgi:quercetin dioxygenase-like cupin family protein